MHVDNNLLLSSDSNNECNTSSRDKSENLISRKTELSREHQDVVRVREKSKQQVEGEKKENENFGILLANLSILLGSFSSLLAKLIFTS